jgi:uncharacterized phage infection (PIP) family protein YhgE
MSFYTTTPTTPSNDVENIYPTGTAGKSDGPVYALLKDVDQNLTARLESKGTVKKLEIQSPGGTESTVKNQEVTVVEGKDYLYCIVSRLDEFGKCIQDLKDGKKESDKCIQDLKDGKKESDKCIQDLKDGKKESDKCIQDLKDGIQDLQDSKKESDKCIQDLQDSSMRACKQHSKHIDVWKARIEESRGFFDASDEHINQLYEDIAELKSCTATFNERIHDLESGEKNSVMAHNKSLTVASGRAE